MSNACTLLKVLCRTNYLTKMKNYCARQFKLPDTYVVGEGVQKFPLRMYLQKLELHNASTCLARSVAWVGHSHAEGDRNTVGNDSTFEVLCVHGDCEHSARKRLPSRLAPT